eukprot:86742-Pelagomonas_calceolata.AAC.1
MPALTFVAHWEPYPQQLLTMLLPTYWVRKEFMLPRLPSWSLQIIAVWNTAARIRLNENNPTWHTDLAQQIPEAR